MWAVQLSVGRVKEKELGRAYIISWSSDKRNYQPRRVLRVLDMRHLGLNLMEPGRRTEMYTSDPISERGWFLSARYPSALHTAHTSKYKRPSLNFASGVSALPELSGLEGLPVSKRDSPRVVIPDRRFGDKDPGGSPEIPRN